MAQFPIAENDILEFAHELQARLAVDKTDYPAPAIEGAELTALITGFEAACDTAVAAQKPRNFEIEAKGPDANTLDWEKPVSSNGGTPIPWANEGMAHGMGAVLTGLPTGVNVEFRVIIAIKTGYSPTSNNRGGGFVAQ